jgi:hypothetical protein
MKKSEQWPRYKYRLIAERLMGEYLPDKAVTGFESSYWVTRGVDMEVTAREEFEQKKRMKVERVGFVWSSADKNIGCSPDGLIVGTGDKEAVEIKSPAPWTQIEYLLAADEDKVWQDYKCQVQGQMIVGQFEAVHFWAYHPRMPPKYVLTRPELPFMTVLRQMLADFLGELHRDYLRAREMGTFIRRDEIMNCVD